MKRTILIIAVVIALGALVAAAFWYFEYGGGTQSPTGNGTYNGSTGSSGQGGAGNGGYSPSTAGGTGSQPSGNGGSPSSTGPVSPTGATSSISSPSSPSANVPAGDAITIGTAHGSVTMKNFYKNAAIVSPGEGALIIDNAAYDVSYSAYDSSFAISLLQTPVMSSRAAASTAFLQSLGISEQDACKLKVTVEAPVSIDPQNAGIDLGLSFCSSTPQ